ncbi:MAG TPA: hypothetical protein VH164_12270 [Ktedonobacteraceae bacterium]|nr:hypothetical protein [Ktedonobacteraceae bacterium]
MNNQFNGFMDRAKYAQENKRISIEQFNAITSRFNANVAANTPLTPEGKAVREYQLGNNNPLAPVNMNKIEVGPGGTIVMSGGGTGTGVSTGGGGGGGTTAGGGAVSTGGGATAGTGQAPAAQTAAPATQPQVQAANTVIDPNTNKPRTPWKDDNKLPNGMDPNDPNVSAALVKQLYPGAVQVQLPDGSITYQMPTPTSLETPAGRDNARLNLNSNATGLDISNRVLTELHKNPLEFATAGSLQGLKQHIASATNDLLQSIGGPVGLDKLSQKYYDKWFTYNTQVPALDALNHQLDFLVAMQLRASGSATGGMMGMSEALERAEGMVGDWHGLGNSPQAVEGRLNTVIGFFKQNIANNLKELPTHSYADPVTNVAQNSQASAQSTSPATSQTTAPTQQRQPTAPAAQQQTAPKQLPLTGLSAFQNMGGQNTSQYIPYNMIAILRSHPNQQARTYFNLNFGPGADAMVLKMYPPTGG